MTKQQIKDELDLLIPPGHTILDCINERGITLAQFAENIEMTPEDLFMLILGKEPLTLEIAKKLTKATIVDHKAFWLDSEALYRKKLENIVNGIANKSVD